MPQPNTTIYPRYGRGELNSPSYGTGAFPYGIKFGFVSPITGSNATAISQL